MDNSYPYIASLTREPFLFYEMRTTAKLMCNGLNDDEIVKRIVQQNLFQYPTEKSIVHEQQARYRTAIADLEQRIANASTGERVKLNKKMTILQAQDIEIRIYEEKIHHLADQMIYIDLDDGVKKNYAIFQDVLAKIK